MMIKEDTPRGLEGWLALLCIGLIVTPIWILVESRDTPSMFTDGSWAALTTPGAEAYIPHYKSLMIAGVCFQLARLLFSVILLILFFFSSLLCWSFEMTVSKLPTTSSNAFLPMVSTLTCPTAVTFAALLSSYIKALSPK